MTSVRGALLISFFMSNGITVLQFLASMIIARLLSPREIGIYSIAAAIIAIAQLFRNVGVANYLVSEKNLTNKKIQAAFGIQIVTSWVLGSVVFFSSWIAAELYNEKAIQEVMAVASISFIFAPFGGVTLSLLLREMRYRERAIVELSSALVHASLSVSLAYAGLGYMSLAWAALGNTITTVCTAALFRPRGLPWLPSFGEARDVLSFSLPTAGADIFRYFRSVIPELVVGRVISLEAVAFLSRATGVIGIFNSIVGQSISRVAFSYFPMQHRAGADLRYVFLKVFDYICVCSIPFFAVMAVMADIVVVVLFGSQWEESVILIRVLSLAAMIVAPFSVTPLILNAIGSVKDSFNIEFCVFLVVVCLVYPAARNGNVAVVALMVIVSVIYSFSSVSKLMAAIMLRRLDVPVVFFRVLPIVIFSVAIPFFLQFSVVSYSKYLILFLGGIGAVVGWLFSVLFFKHPICAEIYKIINRWYGFIKK